MLLEIERAIVSKINQVLSGTFKVKGFPENPKELGQPMPSAQILVGYKRSTFQLISRGPTTLNQSAEFEIKYMLKNLRTHTGVYPVLDLVRTALTGYIPIQGPAQGLYPTDEGFEDLDQSTWYYNQTFTIDLLIPSDAYTELPSVDPPDPIAIVEIRSGLWRSQVGSLPDKSQSILDRVLIVPNE